MYLIPLTYYLKVKLTVVLPEIELARKFIKSWGFRYDNQL